MNIGIDIDNTLTDIEKDLFDIANKYTKKINPNFKDKSPVKFDGFTNMAAFYTDLFGWNNEQLERLHEMGPCVRVVVTAAIV